MITVTTTAPVRHDVEPMTPAERAEIIAKFLDHYTTALAHFSDVELGHEADRVESFQKSKTGKKMRAMVAAERDVRRAHQLLADLGGTADKVADRLRALGIKGARCFSNICPLATYLETQGVTAYIGPDEITVPVGGSEDTYVHLPVPAAVAAFVGHFDGGVYLDLINPELTDVALEGAGA